MRDMVGSNIPSPKDVQGMTATIDGLIRKLDATTVRLDTGERKAILKMPVAAGDGIARSIMRLATEHGVVMPAVDVEAIERDLVLAERLVPLAEASRDLTRILDDTILRSRAEAWYGATALYTALSRISAARPVLKSALAPIVGFFAKGPRPPKPKAPPAGGDT